MIAVYINYPHQRLSIHKNSSVEEKRMQQKVDQRILKISISNLSNQLKRFKDQEFKFQSIQEYNDMWLEIDFNNMDFEIAIAKYILDLISIRYGAMVNCTIEIR